MNLYHGTIYKFKQFDIGFAEEYKDFGLGMYLATQLGHARWYANRMGVTFGI